MVSHGGMSEIIVKGSGPDVAPLSVVIPARNAAGSLGTILRGLAEERNLIHEILVVDDGSSDGTGTLASKLGLALELPVTVMPVAFGNAGAARNTGIRAATGELVFLVDADDELIPDGLRSLVERLVPRPEIDMAIGGYVRRSVDGAEKLRVPRSYAADAQDNARAYLTNRHRSIAMGSAVVRRRAVADFSFPERMPFDEDAIFWGGILSKASVVTTAAPVLIYNVDPERMERRFTETSYMDFRQVSESMDTLLSAGIDEETINWRKGWLAQRIARALIRQERYAEASSFMSLSTCLHPPFRFNRTTLWYWTKIRVGSLVHGQR